MAPFPGAMTSCDPRGGSATTTTSILLAGAFGNARGGGALVLENHELRGTMHLRTAAESVVEQEAQRMGGS